MSKWKPEKLVGVDLGDSVESGKKNMLISNYDN
jgi:hypothetical protein